MKKTLCNPVIVLCLVLFTGVVGYAEENIAKYPSRPISFIHPFPAGTSAELAVRLLSQEAQKFLGQPIVIVNKPGGVGTLGVAAVATARPDGYTLGNTPHSPMFVVPHLQGVPYNPLQDFTMILQFASFNVGVIVKADAPFKSFKDLIAFARQNPKKLTYATPGTNSMQYIIMEQIAKQEKVQFTHIPFKATNEAQMALLGGHIAFAAGDFNYSMVESGDVRLLLLFREERSAEYPHTPVLKDLGYDLPYPTFITVSGPKGLPPGIVKKLEGAFTKAMKEPAFVKGMKEDIRLPIVYRNSKDLTKYVAYNYDTYGRTLKDMGLIK